MERIIRKIKQSELEDSLCFVEKVFTDSEGEESGELVKNLVKEIISKKYYEPNLDLIMVNEKDEIIGYTLFSRFAIDNKYDDTLLLLSPVAVKTELQRRHISKDLIEYGLAKAKELGYKAVIVEGNPRNYNPRGFKSSFNYGIYAHESVGLTDPECLMVIELEEGALNDISGYVDYRYYDALR